MEPNPAPWQTPTPPAAAAPSAAPECPPAGSHWPEALLTAFCEQMAARGLAVDRQRMDADRLYALRQLATAHTQADETMRYLAVRLFRHFEGWQSGVAPTH